MLEVACNYSKQINKVDFEILSNFSKAKLGRQLKLECIKKVEEPVKQPSNDLFLALDLDETLISYRFVIIK